MHAAGLGWTEFGLQGGVDSAGAGDAVHVVEGRTDEQHTVMRLAVGLGAGMARVPCAVVLDPQDGRGEGRGGWEDDRGRRPDRGKRAGPGEGPGR